MYSIYRTLILEATLEAETEEDHGGDGRGHRRVDWAWYQSEMAE